MHLSHFFLQNMSTSEPIPLVLVKLNYIIYYCLIDFKKQRQTVCIETQFICHDS